MKYVFIGLLMAAALDARAQAPAYDLEGRVINDLNQNVAGVILRVRGSKQLALSDAEGCFHLTGISPYAALQIHCPGYRQQYIQLKGQAFLLLRLQALPKADSASIQGEATKPSGSTYSITKTNSL